MVNKPSILDVGCGPESVAAVIFGEEATVFRLDVDPDLNPDFVHDIHNPLPAELHSRFDIVYLSHVLEHMEYRKVVGILRNLRAALKPNAGELWVIVPALEWAAKEIAKDNPSPVLSGFLFGSQVNEWQFHKSGYTLNLLRQYMEAGGLVTRRAYQTQFVVSLTQADGETANYPATQNIVVGMRSE